ncbi:MAG: hypothetical protein EAZ60_29500 [Oscillatoriales cyanobacterium]|nr:MAG: hypothetical protein EAZ60_29500 [Oscillatoriales cyanobacterium]
MFNGFISRLYFQGPLKMLDFEPTAAQKPGFFPYLRLSPRILAKTRFLGPSTELTHGDSETGLRLLPRILAKTRFLGPSTELTHGGSETGFFSLI